ncbi:hypothetical protein BKH43_07835 [Helicobacter sp. 13S00401-1]|uniref:c-type cytochrome n=1 Tax=Helicobacter sp. 13S00401-1 TaxID=1905758 RepID=UPI000BC80ABD|nr:c-type cytochrome [Helicobacter sp. 13S00401-1]PAF48618.1 hypothetical protein BKH43_07835 [Helicobacter sp. 13S00401-1]
MKALKEIGMLIILIIIFGIIYWGVEPLAHSVMYPKTAPADYQYRDLDRLGKIDLSHGDVAKGKMIATSTCAACHGIHSQGIKAPNSNADAAAAFGVVPPDLSDVGLIYDHKYLAHFIKDPVRANRLTAKFQTSCSGLTGEEAAKCAEFNKGKPSFPMPSADGLGLSNADIADLVAYFASIAPKALSDKEVFKNACERCHSVNYDKGQYDEYFGKEVGQKLKSHYGEGLQALTPSDDVAKYLGAHAPDLSMMIRVKGIDGLAKFINNPQNVPLEDIKKNIISKLVKEAQNKEIKALPANLDKKDMDAKINAIQAKTASDYGIKLPANTMKDAYQSEDDYTNMALSMDAMPIGKSMPRVGLTKAAEVQVVNYLQKVGDSKKDQRDSLGIKIMIFFIILAILAFIWKIKIWKDIH